MAALKLSRAGCSRGKVRYVNSTKVKKGRVISQGIKPGKHLQAGTKVPLVVSLGARKPPRG
jgi:beta-lactam-binding protein with PASTA domain